MKSESCSIVSNSLWPHGLYSPWNSPGQNTGVGSLSLLQGIFPTQGSNPGLPHYGQVLYQLSHLHKETILNTLPGLSGKNMRRKRMKCLRATTSNELMFWSNKTSLTFFFFLEILSPLSSWLQVVLNEIQSLFSQFLHLTLPAHHLSAKSLTQTRNDVWASAPAARFETWILGSD